MRAHYIQLIERTDNLLSIMRAAWLYVQTPEAESKLQAVFNQLLDERLRLMALRDAATPATAHA